MGKGEIARNENGLVSVQLVNHQSLQLSHNYETSACKVTEFHYFCFVFQDDDDDEDSDSEGDLFGDTKKQNDEGDETEESDVEEKEQSQDKVRMK